MLLMMVLIVLLIIVGSIDGAHGGSGDAVSSDFA